MFSRVSALSAVIACVVCLGMIGQASTPPPSQVPTQEVRGLWVLRTSMTSPERIQEVVTRAVSGGYNTLLVQVRGRGDAFYQSAHDPRALELRTAGASFDPLDEMVTRAHAAGLKVHAWFNTNLVASAVSVPTDPKHIVRRHPEWLMVPQQLAPMLHRRQPTQAAYLTELARWTRRESATVEGLFLSPIPEASQEYTLSVVRDLIERYPVDGLHLDYIRYPSPDFDMSAAALEAFHAHMAPRVPPADRARLDQRAVKEPLVWTRTYPDAWLEFRRARLTQLVERIRALTNARGTMQLTAAVWPSPDEARGRKLQDWSAWAEAGLLDAICPMAYAEAPAAFRAQVAATMGGAHGRPVWAGIGAWRLPASRTAGAIEATRSAGTSGFLLFSYDSLVEQGRRGSYFTTLRPTVAPDRP
ncbi:MAG: hypothetical protein AMXMBFR57_25090 [Acidimicrobiia bacterium]